MHKNLGTIMLEYSYMHSRSLVVSLSLSPTSLFLVPSPTVILTVLSYEPHVIGGTFSVLCQATVSHHVNTPVSVDFTWRRTSGLITSDSDSRITISDTTPVSGLSYSSTLTINDLGIGADSQMSYDCEAVVRSDSSSPYILSSITATSITYLLHVFGILF